MDDYSDILAREAGIDPHAFGRYDDGLSVRGARHRRRTRPNGEVVDRTDRRGNGLFWMLLLVFGVGLYTFWPEISYAVTSDRAVPAMSAPGVPAQALPGDPGRPVSDRDPLEAFDELTLGMTRADLVAVMAAEPALDIETLLVWHLDDDLADRISVVIEDDVVATVMLHRSPDLLDSADLEAAAAVLSPGAGVSAVLSTVGAPFESAIRDAWGGAEEVALVWQGAQGGWLDAVFEDGVLQRWWFTAE